MHYSNKLSFEITIPKLQLSFQTILLFLILVYFVLSSSTSLPEKGEMQTNIAVEFICLYLIFKSFVNYQHKYLAT